MRRANASIALILPVVGTQRSSWLDAYCSAWPIGMIDSICASEIPGSAAIAARCASNASTPRVALNTASAMSSRADRTSDIGMLCAIGRKRWYCSR